MNGIRKIATNENWLDWLESENVQLILLDPQDDKDEVEAVHMLPGWQLDIEDEELVGFTRAEETGAAYF